MEFVKIFFLSLVLMTIWNVESQEQFKSDIIPLDPAVRHGRLDNGFTYYLRKNDVPNNSVVLNLVVKAGVYHQDEDQLEYAHLLEHLVSKEAEILPGSVDIFSGPGRYSNAKTGMDNTSYYAVLPTEDKQVIRKGLEVVRRWAQDIQWDSASTSVERAAVLGEMRVNDPYRKWIGETIEKHVLIGTGLDYSPREKSKVNIEKFDAKALERFYNDWYRPDLEAAIIVGDINLDSMELDIRRLFSDLKAPEHPKNERGRVDDQVLNLKGKNNFITILDSLHPDFRVEIIRKNPNFMYRPKTKNDYRHMLLQQLWGILIDGRAEQLEQQYDPPFSSFSPNYRSNSLGGGQMNVIRMTIELEADDSQQTKSHFIRGLTAWKRMHTGITDAELEKAKRQILVHYSDSSFGTSFSLAQRLRQHFVKGTAAPDLEVELKLVSRILTKIDIEDINDYILKFGHLNRNTDFIFFKGKGQDVPDHYSFQQWIKEVNTANVEPIVSPLPAIKSLSGIAQKPITDKKKNINIFENVIGVSTVELEGGIKLILKPTEPNSESFANTITINGFRPNGIPRGNRKEYLAAKIAPEVLKFTGAGPYDKFELEQFMRGKGIKIRFKTSKDFQLIFGECKITSLQELINLLYLYLNKPRNDLNGFIAWKEYKEEQLKGNGIRGSAEFVTDKILSLWYPEEPVMEMQDLMELSLQEVLDASDRWFSDVQNYTFIVTGDFNQEDVLPILVDNFTAFPKRKEFLVDTLDDFEFPLKKMNEKLYFPYIEQAYVSLFFPITAPRNIKTQVELKLLSRALGDRIYTRLREGCYAPSGGGEWLDVPNNVYAFRVNFDSALGNDSIMLNFAMEEFRKLKERGVDKEWLESAIAIELDSFEGRYDSFGYFNFWSDYLQLKLQYGEDPVEGILSYGTLLEHFISLEEINSAAKKYLSEENLQQFLGYPEEYREVK